MSVCPRCKGVRVIGRRFPHQEKCPTCHGTGISPFPSAYKQHGGEDSWVRPDGRHPDFIIRDFFKGSDWEERIEEMIQEGLTERCPTCGKTGPDSIDRDFDSGMLDAACGDPWHDRRSGSSR